jgi:hypothetical protein
LISNYLFNVSEKSHIPIEIDFEQDGFEVPCLISPSENDQYQSYLAIIPGKLLATIYETVWVSSAGTKCSVIPAIQRKDQ